MVLGALSLAFAPASAPASTSTSPPRQTLRQLVEVVDLSSLAISPDGRRVAFRQAQSSLERNAKQLSWWIVDLDGRTLARRVADGGRALWSYGGTMTSEPPQWSSDGQSFYFRALIEGQVQVWRAGVEGAPARQVTHDDSDVSAFDLIEGGDGLRFTVGATRAAIVQAEQDQRDQGVQIDRTIDPAQNLFAAGEINGRLAAQRLSGAWFKRGGLLSDQPDVQKQLDLSQPDEVATTLVDDDAPNGRTTRDPSEAWSDAGFGRAALVDKAETRTVQVTRPWGRIVTCPQDLCRFAKALAWRPGADELILTLGDAARRQWLVSWRPARGTLRQLTTPQGLIGGGASTEPCAMTRSAAICVTEGPSMAPRLVRVPLDSGQPLPLATPNAALDAAAKPQTRLLEWRDDAGRAFSGWLMQPAGPPKQHPLFVTYYLCEGYPRGGFGDEFPLAALAQAGIASLCINKAYQSVSHHDPVGDYRTGLSAIQAVVSLLDSQGLIDRAKIGMGGFSFGSEVTTWVAMNSDLLAAASIASTQMEPAYYWLNGAAGRQNHAVLQRSWKLGAPEETPEQWRLISPALNTDKIHAALLMQMPEQEYRLSFELFARLSNSKTPVDLYVFADEPHIKTQPRHRLAVYERNLDWFRFWLQDYVDPDPAKAEQYRHWREMAARRVNESGR